MKKIFCTFSLFSLNQTVFLVNDENDIREIATIETADFEKKISEFCDFYNVNNVILQGNKSYCEALGEGIKRENILNYNNHNIEVEVISSYDIPD